MKFLLLTFFLFSNHSAKSQKTDIESYFLKFMSFQKMSVSLDSMGKVFLSLGWEKDNNKVTIDAFGNKITIIKDGSLENKVYKLGIKGITYQDKITSLTFIPFFQCVDPDGKKCNIRISLLEENRINIGASYLFIDYKDATEIFQIFLQKI